jgi:hypothetical protein
MSTKWRCIGPKGFGNRWGYPAATGSPVNGRVNCVVYHPKDDATRYIGGAEGGLWKTTDRGASWRALGDAWSTLNVSSVAIDRHKPDYVYVGTGDWPDESGSCVGVLRSEDGGGSWKESLSSTKIISCLATHPDLQGIVLATEWNGALHRFDGSEWSIPSGLGSLASAWWMGIVFGLKIGKVRPCYAICEGNGGTIMRSKDDGKSWEAVSYPAVKGWQQRSMLVASPTISGRLYLCLPNRANSVFQGDDDLSKPIEWVDITGSFPKVSSAWGQGTYSFSMCCAASKIHGESKDVVFVGQALISYRVIGETGSDWKSTSSLEDSSKGVFYAHADQHALGVSPLDSSVVMVGCDGGVYEMVYDAQTDKLQMSSQNTDLTITQCYKIAASRDGAYSLIGAQDVGAPAMLPGGAPGAQANDGDGGGCAINPVNALVQYCTGDFNGTFRRTEDGWASFMADGMSGSKTKDIDLGVNKGERMWNASPMVLDPNDADTLYLATNFVYRWNDATQEVEPRLGNQSLSAKGWVNGIAIASANSKRLYTCSNDGEVYVSTTRGKAWSNISANLPSGSFNTICADNPNDADDVLVGIDALSSGKHLWRCKNPTAAHPTWTDVSGKGADVLPDAPVHAILRDPDDPASTWYVGTGQGLYKTDDAGETWHDHWASLGAPVVEVRDLIKIGPRVRAGTYGRGIWEYFPGTLQIFYRGEDTAIWSRWRDPQGNWSPESQIGGSVIGDAAACQVPNERTLQLFYRGTDKALWTRWRDSDGNWSGEDRLGGALIGDPIVTVIPGTNTLQVFYRGTDRSIYTRWRQSDGVWSGENKVGGVLITDPIAAVVPIANILQLFYEGTDHGIYSMWRHQDGSWSVEHKIGGILSGRPAAIVLPGSNTLQLFYRGTDNGVWTLWRYPDGAWSVAQSLDGQLDGDPVPAVVPGTSTLQIFYRGTDHSIYTRWRHRDGSWSVEQHVGGHAKDDPIATTLPGTDILQLFYRGPDSSVRTMWRDEHGTWSSEQNLDGKAAGHVLAATVPA